MRSLIVKRAEEEEEAVSALRRVARRRFVCVWARRAARVAAREACAAVREECSAAKVVM